jgi:hypothetical protein
MMAEREAVERAFLAALRELHPGVVWSIRPHGGPYDGAPPPAPEHYVTRADLARILGVSTKTVDRMVGAGMPSEVWGKRARRFLPSEAIAWAGARDGRS